MSRVSGNTDCLEANNDSKHLPYRKFPLNWDSSGVFLVLLLLIILTSGCEGTDEFIASGPFDHLDNETFSYVCECE